ncbi:hypothetical protein CDL15_Pgr004714 [Punica granatum]|uniref:Uncharacterized protein n=1 Tax=Punica granatum TaxID=22663 RepID=A0A218W805_PUNGR|nr:hypothetical protein CDL15_Pgr004714 [Punica granatum]
MWRRYEGRDEGMVGLQRTAPILRKPNSASRIEGSRVEGSRVAGSRVAGSSRGRSRGLEGRGSRVRLRLVSWSE